jgi:hypothetical protein
MDTLEEKHQPHFLFSTSSARTTHEEGSCSSFKQVQYGLRDEDLDYNHEMDDMESSSEGEESIDEDVFED